MRDADGSMSNESDSVSDAFSSVKDSYCQVDRVNISPPDLKTRLFILEREFRKAKEARTLEQVSKYASEALMNLKDLGTVRSASAELVSGDASKPGTCHIDVSVEEASRVAYKVGTYVQRFDACVEGMFKVRNLTGNCEHQSLEVSRSLGNTIDLAYKYRQPRIYGWPVHVINMVHQRYESFQRESSFTEMLRGGSVDAVTSDGRHSLGYELSWIQLADARRRASPEVLSQMGDHVKSALRYTLVHDGRDNPVYPSRGAAARLSTELAGLTPDADAVRYVRQTVDLQAVAPLSQSATLTVDANMGVMLPFGDSWTGGKATMIRDRFYLGGVSNLRGFAWKGVGPRGARRCLREAEEGDGADPGSDALGGDIFASVRAAVQFAMPVKALHDAGVRGHIFADAGSIAQLAGTARPMQQNFEDFWNQWRMSFGVGLKVAMGVGGHFELNFVQLLKHYGHDRTRAGFQFGFSSAPYTQVPPYAM